jgi:hypothetical protein
MSTFTFNDLERLGYKKQSDGSYAKMPITTAPSHPTSKRLPNSQSQPTARKTLGRTTKREKESPPRFRVCITRKAISLLDTDNFAGGCKPLIDQLRYHELIPNDDPASIDLVFRQEKVRSKHLQGTTVEIRLLL